MAITATNSGVKRELIPADTYVARCYSMIHVGTNEEEIMGETKRLNKVRLTWELPNELREFDGVQKPLVISKEYTLSMHEKATLRKDLESWRGLGFTEEEAKSFDITKLLGIPCMLSVVHTKSKSGDMYAKIGSISKIMKGMQCPAQINPSFEFNYTDKFSDEVVETLPDFIKEKIKSSEEYKELKAGEISKPEPEETYIDQNTTNNNDLPF